MKKLMKFFGIVAVAAMSLTACQNEFDEQVNVNGGETVVVDITANAPATRSAFGDKDGNAYPSTWSGKETVGFSVNGGTFVDVENESTSASAKFSGVALTPATEGFVYAVSPRNTTTNNAYEVGGFRSISSSYSSFSIAIPKDQTPSDKSVDELAHLLFAKYEITEGAIPASISMDFEHIGAYGKMNITGYTGGTIEKITLTSTQQFVGQAYYYYNTGEMEPQSYASETLTLKTSNTEGVWFACHPVGTLTGNLTIVITDSGNVTYTKELATAGRLAFNAGQVSVFSVDMSKDVTVDAPAAGEVTTTLDFSNTVQRKSLTTEQQVWTNKDVVLTIDKSSGSDIADYSNPLRIYKSHNVTISAPGNITKIVFNCTSSTYATVMKDTTKGTVSGNVVTWTPDTVKTEHSFTMTAQSRVSSIVVTYNTTGEIVPTLGDVEDLEAIADGKDILITWADVENAEEYVVTCGDRSQTVTETTAEFTMADWSTYYDITVVAKAEGYNNSATAETTVMTEADPNEEIPTSGERTYTFADYAAGTQYATGEAHVMDEILTITTTESHFTSELRIYSSSTHNGFAIGDLADGLKITNLTLNAGYKVDTLNVYGSNDGGNTWTLVQAVSVTSTSYADYAVDFTGTNYNMFKLDVAGTNQVRIKKLTLAFAAAN